VFGAVSEAEARLARQTLRAARIAVVPNGIPDLDPGRSPPLPPRAGRPAVVAAGRIGAQLQPAETARILAGLADAADVRWIGGAPGDEDAPLRAAGIPVTGWMPREQALDALGRAAVLVHWSAWDGLSLTVLEALARDVVVIGSDIPPNREILGEQQVPRSPDAAVALVRKVLSDPREREHLLAQQRRRRVAFGAQRMIDEWCALYARIASTG
jgi:glycosyltransferase involved in cell wall biosynthesis